MLVGRAKRDHASDPGHRHGDLASGMGRAATGADHRHCDEGGDAGRGLRRVSRIRLGGLVW